MRTFQPEHWVRRVLAVVNSLTVKSALIAYAPAYRSLRRAPSMGMALRDRVRPLLLRGILVGDLKIAH